jgi:hypothetical protein
MNVGIGWSIVLNTTELEFHQLQHKLKDIISKEVLHCLPKGRMELLKDDVEIEDVLFDIYVRLHDYGLEFACIFKEHIDKYVYE